MQVKLEKKLCSTKLEESRMACQDSLKVFMKTLRQTRKDNYSALIEENKNKPRILFSTVARLTESHYSAFQEPTPLWTYFKIKFYLSEKISYTSHILQQELLWMFLILICVWKPPIQLNLLNWLHHYLNSKPVY